MEKRYFAYGTLLDVESMRKSCPSAQPLGIMKLMDYRMGFATCAADPAHGGCTLDPAPGEVIHGLLYALPARELESLDKSAGVDAGLWDTIAVTLINGDERKVTANTYTVKNSAGPWNPPDSYVAPILKGARELNLPADYVAKLEAIIEAAQS